MEYKIRSESKVGQIKSEEHNSSDVALSVFFFHLFSAPEVTPRFQPGVSNLRPEWGLSGKDLTLLVILHQSTLVVVKLLIIVRITLNNRKFPVFVVCLFFYSKVTVKEKQKRKQINK